MCLPALMLLHKAAGRMLMKMIIKLQMQMPAAHAQRKVAIYPMLPSSRFCC
jgi:hypothetical protein